MRLFAPLLVALGFASCLLPTAAAPARSTELAKKCAWTKVLEVPGAFFDDVAVAQGEVWAVGYKGQRDASPLIAHWDGTTWTTTTDDVRGRHEQIVARSPSELWISGRQDGKWVLRSYDGHAWKTQARAVDFANSARPRDVWLSEGPQLIGLLRNGAERRVTVPPGATDYWGRFAVDPTAGIWIDDDAWFYRWQGRRWARLRHPSNSAGGGVLAAATTNEAWSVGNSIERWDGVSWKLVGHGGEYQVMHDVDALPGKALVVGKDWGRTSARGHGVIAEWDGGRFRNTAYLGSRSPLNNAVSDVSTVEAVNGVAFATATRAWAVGYGGFADMGVVYRGTCRW